MVRELGGRWRCGAGCKRDGDGADLGFMLGRQIEARDGLELWLRVELSGLSWDVLVGGTCAPSAG